jgi:ribosomal protein S12 methylthiotransferase
MGRRGDRKGYTELVRRIRTRLPEAVIRSTFLVGFPGESDEDFRELLQFQRDVRFDLLGVFSYSREEGTPASRMLGRRAYRKQQKTACERKDAVQQAQQPITEEFLRTFIGSSQQVLIEEPIQGVNLYLGRGYMQAPEVDGLMVVKGEELFPGEMTTSRVPRLVGVDLEAEVIRPCGP